MLYNLKCNFKNKLNILRSHYNKTVERNRTSLDVCARLLFLVWWEKLCFLLPFYDFSRRIHIQRQWLLFSNCYATQSFLCLQYKTLFFPFLGGGGIKVSLSTACCCQKVLLHPKMQWKERFSLSFCKCARKIFWRFLTILNMFF